MQKDNQLETSDKQKISQLIESYPLYKKTAVKTEALAAPLALSNLTFTFNCKADGMQTFRLVPQPRRIFSGVKVKATGISTDDFEAIKDNDSQYNYFQYYSGYCQYCQKYKVDFLIHIHSNPDGNIYFTKVGQSPAFSLKPDAELYQWLTEEDRSYYDKAIMCKSQNYGIGAYAYLRRIVQNEIERIVEDLSKMDSGEGDKIKQLLDTYGKDHQMEKLITGTANYMPKSLDGLGENPLKFLYHELSGGIHEFSEEVCFGKADALDTVLKFVIRKINEENSELKKVREALKKGNK